MIDDDVAIRDSTELLFQTADIDINVYSSATEFFRDANLNEIRCLVIDVDMPRINGIDLLDRLRRGGIKAPGIFITGRGDTADLRAAAVRTAAAVLLKPFKPAELIRLVQRRLGDSRR